ncbi:peroxidase 27 [Dorcoceras hygrometricum]|uniref:Peroxidase 27 n=1 Tax=Dorcoceras hygrometricum TaxID=472368 RepID=A0A2Z7C1K4_9LAMI|nr:peroxidase 27 [Dorcoceras hygrometricum]
MVHEYKKLSQTFEEVNAENMDLKNSSVEPSTVQLGETDSSQIELTKLKSENDSLRLRSYELESENKRLNLLKLDLFKPKSGGFSCEHPMHEETSADQIDFLVDTAVDGEAPVTRISLPAVDTSDVAKSLSQLRASITRLSINQLNNSSKIGDLQNHLLFKIENLEKAFKEALSNQEQVFRNLMQSTRQEAKFQQNALSLELLEFKKGKTESGIAHVSSQLSEIITYINRGGNDKKGEVSSSHDRGQPPPEDGGGSSSRSEPSRIRGSSGSKKRIGDIG